VDNSGIPRAFSPTNAKRRAEDQARAIERRSSARNASNSTIGAGGKLTLAGGIDIIQGGVVKVIGQGMNGAVPYIVTAELTNFLEDFSDEDYQSPGMLFSSEMYGKNVARLYSRDGQSITLDAKSGASSSSLLVNPFVTGIQRYEDEGNFNFRSGQIEANSTQARVTLISDTNSYHAGMLVQDDLIPTGEAIFGHLPYFASTIIARLRTRAGGKLWLESKGATGATAAVVMDGAGNMNLQTSGTLTQNGSATFPPTIGTTATTAKAGNYTPAIADVTGLQAALDGKAGTAEVWKPKFKNQPTTLGGGPWPQNVYTSIGPAISIPANPFGVGVPYKINFYGQAVATLNSAGSFCAAQAKRGGVIFGSNVSNTARGAPETVVASVKYSVPVVDGSASTITFEWGPFFSTATLDTAAARTYFEVDVTPYTAL
jgi:hypothetical protein